MSSTTHRTRARRLARARRGRRGAAMLAVMLVVLMVTATGMFAVYSATYELRSAGSFRQAMQTQYVAEGGIQTGMALIDTMGAGSIDVAMQRVPVAAGVQFTREEPAYAQSTPHFRVYSTDFPTMPSVVAQPVEVNTATSGGTSLGNALAYTPTFLIDMDDSYRPGRAIAGQSVTGSSPVSYRVWTITSRGRTAPVGFTDTYTSGETATTPAAIRRGSHETAMNSRAVVLSGPL